MSTEALDLRPVCVRDVLVAHTPGAAGRWHGLDEHSRAVGEMASEFAAPFGAGDFARLMGYLHDSGKATEDIQYRLRVRGADEAEVRRRLGAPHKREGGLLAASLLGRQNHLATWAYLACLGHHSGIPSRRSAQTAADVSAALTQVDALAPLRTVMERVVGADLQHLANRCEVPAWLLAERDAKLAHFELFTRMCHSALVDADFLDTEAHFKGLDQPWKAREYGMVSLRDAFMSEYSRRFADARDTKLNRVRRDVFQASVRAGEDRREAGIFRLPAPTGTGKTMAAAAFALNHAARFGKRRVIVAVPFTTITTQNAAEYRGMFPGLKNVVLENHSDLVDQGDEDSVWRGLSASQWDAEFIVTTTVQLFESLFSNRPSRTRKLHRIAHSVIVLDEVQSLPLDLLGPILRMLRELTEHYGVTVLLASATQPAFWELPAFAGLPAYDILPIDSVPEVTQRVTYTVRQQRQTWDEVADELSARRQALVIVNTRGDADTLFDSLRHRVDEPGDVYLLSRSMTSDHRRRVLVDVKASIGSGSPVWLVSTQLIEAGVDIDFPVVYRALASADSIVQAGGRCNREGRLEARAGEVVVFQPIDGHMPGGLYSELTKITQGQFASRGATGTFDDPEALQRYYRTVARQITQIEAGAQKFLELRGCADFPETAHEFRMIKDEVGVSVVVTQHPDHETAARIRQTLDQLKAHPLVPLDRRTRRWLNRYTATVSKKDQLLAMDLSQDIIEWAGTYDSRRGAVGDVGLTW